MSLLLQVSGISKQNDTGFQLEDIRFNLQRRQRIAIAGATGSGKSTLLKIIAGWIQPDSGEVLFKNTRVKGPNEQLIPGHPAIAYLSQHFELRHRYRVIEELDYVNQLSSKAANRLFELCQVQHLLGRWTNQLSGGERQRVALTRTLLSSPSLLLLDEPYSNLDLQHKNILKQVVHDISTKLNITVLMVSHDAGDILPWAEEIHILRNGSILESGAPQTLYQHPTHLYTAGLLGKYNIIPPHLIKGTPKQTGTMIVRPEHCFAHLRKTPASAKATIAAIHYFGYMTEIDLLLKEEHPFTVRAFEKTALKPGENIYVSVDTNMITPVKHD